MSRLGALLHVVETYGFGKANEDVEWASLTESERDVWRKRATEVLPEMREVWEWWVESQQEQERAMIMVTSEVTVYEVDGKAPTTLIDGPKVVVRSHWNSHERVVIEFEGRRFTVLAKDLSAAIANATNTSRF